MAANGGKLRESSFFTEREAIILSAHFLESRGVASTSSSSSYSPRIHALMESKSKLGMSEVDAEIEASKAHWTETKYVTATSEIDDSSMVDSSTVTNCGEEQLSEEERVKLYEENAEAMRSLMKVWRQFLEIGGTVGGRKIGEGGQAEIYEGGIKNIQFDSIGDREVKFDTVMKVFKEGTTLLELQKQWPPHLRMLKDVDHKYSKVINISCVRLLDDRRLAFEMNRCLGDLRKFLDVRMEHNGNRYPPLMMEDGNYHESCMFSMMENIATGMRYLHGMQTLHRDLKASNVLVTFVNWKNDPSKWEDIQLRLWKVENILEYLVADYECSLGVMGTGFWRAPEILEASKNRTLHDTPDLFTKKSDVYSYAMTCYEIFTGFIPFKDPMDGTTSVEDVVEGKRPTLPSHLKPWVKELFHKCWHTDPSLRPSFVDIEHTLEREWRKLKLEKIRSFNRRLHRKRI